jgi:hypothetical protein
MIRRKQSRIKNGLTQAIYERNHLKKNFYALLVNFYFRLMYSYIPDLKNLKKIYLQTFN